METEESLTFALSKEKADDIAVFCSVAKANGTNLSLNEIIQLASLDVSEEQLERAWSIEPSLSSLYEVSAGFVHEKGTERATNKQSSERYLRAESNISYAEKFAGLVNDSKLRMISISGSTSYHSVSREDDLDFFCVAKKDAMWFFLFKALIKARLLRMKDKKAPWLCLSYVMDESYAESEFTSPQDALFARDAISTIVLRGGKYYDSLLARCDWISRYFPKMYGARTVKEARFEREPSLRTSFFGKELNTLLYFTVGTYIRIKSYLLNRKFRRGGQKSRMFSLRIGWDHCIYESQSYLELRRMYAALEKKGQENERLE